jgi:DNA repair protein RecO (recombination protein O)
LLQTFLLFLNLQLYLSQSLSICLVFPAMFSALANSGQGILQHSSVQFSTLSSEVMPLHDTSAFVLRTYPLAEHHKICVFLTRKNGIIRAVAHGSRRLKSRYGASLEPFTEVQLCYFEKEGQELVQIRQCDILNSSFRWAAQAETAVMLAYIGELLCEFSPANEANDRLYRLVAAILAAVQQQASPEILVRYFEIWLLRLSGFFPDLTHCIVCESAIDTPNSIWLAPDGTPQCYQCSGGRGTQLTPATVQTLDTILHNNPQNFVAAAPSPESLRVINEIAYRFIRRTLERDLRSYVAMNQVQADLKQHPIS